MTTAPPAGRPRDPARGLRGIGAAILITHAITVGLAIPVVVNVSHRAYTAGVVGLVVIVVLDVVAAGMLRRAEREVIVLGSVLQAATVLAGLMSGVLLFLGLVFGGLWIGWLSMRRSFAAAKAAYEARSAAGEPEPVPGGESEPVPAGEAEPVPGGEAEPASGRAPEPRPGGESSRGRPDRSR
jgi:Protein of unknown function (DUF4233)